MAAFIPASLSLSGCWGGNIHASYVATSEGAAARGRSIILEKNCGSCHMIPGIRGADGLVGPPLIAFGRRSYIAGELPNNEANLVRWLQSPPSVEPQTAMPELGLSEAQAKDVAAYLLNLQTTNWVSR
jgi:mono/diheme cytochrome c family protein